MNSLKEQIDALMTGEACYHKGRFQNKLCCFFIATDLVL